MFRKNRLADFCVLLAGLLIPPILLTVYVYADTGLPKCNEKKPGPQNECPAAESFCWGQEDEESCLASDDEVQSTSEFLEPCVEGGTANMHCENYQVICVLFYECVWEEGPFEDDECQQGDPKLDHEGNQLRSATTGGRHVSCDPFGES